MSLADWIKFRKKLWSDGRVREMSRILRTNRGQVVGALVRMWSLADEYADQDGHMPGYTRADIDAEVEVAGWCDALPAEWFSEDDQGIYLPDYQEHNGTTAKKRAVDSKRKQDDRASGTCPQNVRKDSDKNRTREEKIREEKNNTPLISPQKIILNWGSRTWENISEQDWQTWARAYPAVDCKQEVLKALAWCISNPAKGKKSNYRKFLTSWLNRSQDGGGNRGASVPQSPARIQAPPGKYEGRGIEC